ncbi:MAG: YjjG family noncanonical pyrimidine nucleotidase [Bacteroidia bacterium]|nr:YjjG family noncanonical pyrimidine nucleotidase [Bacteroidia bacterium]
MKKYSHIFFDFDRTIWDYETNADEAIRELAVHYSLAARGIENTNLFITEYNKINDDLWERYGKNEVTKEELRSQRFHLAFLKFGLKDFEMAQQISADFTVLACQKPHLVPGAKELLDYLKGRYPIHLITNGFEETQKMKIKHARVGHYFDSMITSERAQAKKPAKEIFEFALRETGADPANSIMIGDHYELDALAAMKVGMDGVWFTNSEIKESEATYTVQKLVELKGMF